MKLYGIRNCDTVKKARKWLDDAGIDYGDSNDAFFANVAAHFDNTQLKTLIQDQDGKPKTLKKDNVQILAR